MSILIDSRTKLVIQGITGKAAQHHAMLMREYGTDVVAGVRPGAGGDEVHGIPIFDTVAEACGACKPDTSILFVPAKVMKEAAFEALDAGIKKLVLISEHVPVHDSMEIIAKAKGAKALIVGPNTPGVISPGERCKVGFVPSAYYMPGNIGVASRSGTLTYELVARLTEAKIGQSTCVGIGGDPVVGTPFSSILLLFERDPETRAILLIGEIGGTMEEEAADMVQQGVIKKPVIAYLAGRTAPPGKRMGHAGAIIAGGRGSISCKLRAFENASIPVASVPGEVPDLIKTAMSASGF